MYKLDTKCKIENGQSVLGHNINAAMERVYIYDNNYYFLFMKDALLSDFRIA